ncbi:MAG TPA: hypothetical protein P5123_06425 [Spirochaetota bacterium]|nr:hypothetical protein [Spirochaetota bacterium]
MKGFFRNLALQKDLLLSITGLCLVLFIVAHLAMDATIIIGPDAFNGIATILERFYLAQIGVPLVILALVTHIVVALLKQKNKFLSVSKAFVRATHPETLIWIIQLTTGLLLIGLALLHVVVIVLDNVTKINIVSTSVRIADVKFQIFYHVLMNVTMVHISCGIYRLYAKWVGSGRRKFIPFVLLFFLIYWSVSTVALQKYMDYAPHFKKLKSLLIDYEKDRENDVLRHKIIKISLEQNISITPELLKKIGIDKDILPDFSNTGH